MSGGAGTCPRDPSSLFRGRPSRWSADSLRRPSGTPRRGGRDRDPSEGRNPRLLARGSRRTPGSDVLGRETQRTTGALSRRAALTPPGAGDPAGVFRRKSDVRTRFGPAGRQDETEGGEALAVAAVEIHGASAKAAALAAEAGTAFSGSRAPWHVLWTHSHSERLVYDQLAARGFHPFLPSMGAWSTWAGRRRLISVPMFPGYPCLNDALDKAAHVETRKARGVVRVLGETWDGPARVSDAEIHALRQVVDSGLPTLPYPYLREDRTSTRLNSSHVKISYAVFCLKK